MDTSQANILLIEQLKRHLAEVMEEIEQYKLQEAYLLARLRKAEGGVKDETDNE